MYSKLCDSLVFSILDYKQDKQLNLNSEIEARNEMYNDIATILSILIKNKYMVSIRNDDTDIITLEYGHNEYNDDAWGTPILTWITNEEYENIMNKREQEKHTCNCRECSYEEEIDVEKELKREFDLLLP